MMTLLPQRYIIHVDSERLKECRAGADKPVIRIVDGETLAPLGYCREAKCLDSSVIYEHWENPLPDRPGAIAVLRTSGPVEVYGYESPELR